MCFFRTSRDKRDENNEERNYKSNFVMFKFIEGLGISMKRVFYENTIQGLVKVHLTAHEQA